MNKNDNKHSHNKIDTNRIINQLLITKFDGHK